MQLQTPNGGINKTDGEQSVDRTQDMLMMAGTQQLLSHLWKSKAEGGDGVGQWGDKQRRLERQIHARRRGCFMLNNRESSWRGENILYREGTDTVCLSTMQKWSFYSFEVCWIKPNMTLRWSSDITGLDCDSQPAVRGGGSAAQTVNLTVWGNPKGELNNSTPHFTEFFSNTMTQELTQRSATRSRGERGSFCAHCG